MRKLNATLAVAIAVILLLPTALFGMIVGACCGVNATDLEVTAPEEACVCNDVTIAGSYYAYGDPGNEGVWFATGIYVKVWPPGADPLIDPPMIDDEIVLDDDENMEDDLYMGPYNFEFDFHVSEEGTYSWQITAWVMFSDGVRMENTIVGGEIVAEICCPVEVWCVEAVNPHGNNTPGKNRSDNAKDKAVNPDGFYELGAVDCEQEPLRVMVGCKGCRELDPEFEPFGPFPSGTIVKFTEAPGATPSMKEIGSANGKAGAVAYHITLPGEPIVWTPTPWGPVGCPCFVPPPPK
jgi:hypothetical protein